MNNGPTGEPKPKLNERLRKSRERIAEFRAESQAKARRVVRVTNNYAHDHPWRMVATGAALAFAVGFLMNTKRPRKIVLKQPRNVIKVKPVKTVEKKKHGGFNMLQAFMPLVMLGAKQYMASRQKNQSRTQPVEPAPVP